MDLGLINERLVGLYRHKTKLLEEKSEGFEKKLVSLSKTISYYEGLREKYKKKEVERGEEIKLPPPVGTPGTNNVVNAPYPVMPTNIVNVPYPDLNMEFGSEANGSGTKKKNGGDGKKSKVNSGEKKENTQRNRRKRNLKNGLSLIRNLPAIGKVMLDDLVNPPSKESQSNTHGGRTDVENGKDGQEEDSAAFLKRHNIKIIREEPPLSEEEKRLIDAEMAKIEQDIEDEDGDFDLLTSQEDSLRRMFGEIDRGEFLTGSRDASGENSLGRALSELEMQMKEDEKKVSVGVNTKKN